LQTLTGAMLKVETLISNNRFAISLFNPKAKSYKYEEKKITKINNDIIGSKQGK
jgi:hypothetical protein